MKSTRNESCRGVVGRIAAAALAFFLLTVMMDSSLYAVYGLVSDQPPQISVNPATNKAQVSFFDPVRKTWIKSDPNLSNLPVGTPGGVNTSNGIIAWSYSKSNGFLDIFCATYDYDMGVVYVNHISGDGLDYELGSGVLKVKHTNNYSYSFYGFTKYSGFGCTGIVGTAAGDCPGGNTMGYGNIVYDACHVGGHEVTIAVPTIAQDNPVSIRLDNLDDTPHGHGTVQSVQSGEGTVMVKIIGGAREGEHRFWINQALKRWEIGVPDSNTPRPLLYGFKPFVSGYIPGAVFFYDFSSELYNGIRVWKYRKKGELFSEKVFSLRRAPYFVFPEGGTYVVTQQVGDRVTSQEITVPAPAFSGSVEILDQSGYSYSRDVTLAVVCSAATEVCFSNDQVTWSEWEQMPTNQSKYWTLLPRDPNVTDPASPKCLRFVYAKFRNAAGQIVEAFDSTKLVPAPTITVLSPNGGEYWYKGETRRISWNTTTPLTCVVELWKGDQRMQVLGVYKPMQDDWTVLGTLPSGADYRFRVMSLDDDTVMDESDAPFSILSPTISITSPVGYENWVTNSEHTINWVTSNPASTVDLHYSTDNGATWNPIAMNVPNTSSYNWTVPSTPAAACLLRVANSTNNLEVEVSDRPFAIVNALPPIVKLSDLNNDGGSDMLWRYYAEGGYNCVWLGNTTPGARTGAFSSALPLPQVDMVNLPPTRPLSEEEMGGFAEPNMKENIKPEAIANRLAAANWDDPGDSPAVDSISDPRTAANATVLSTVALLSWQLSGVGDFDGDGKNDLVWHNKDDGRNVVWRMNGTTFIGPTSLNSTSSNLNWEIGGVADFSGDGKPDILWRNKGDGRNVIWIMNNAVISQVKALPVNTDQNWVIGGVGDFNHDGSPDIVWHNKADARNFIWAMTGTDVMSEIPLPNNANTGWEIVSVGDYTNDGNIDILWRNYVDGRNMLWKMDQFTRRSTTQLTVVTDLNWRIGK